MSVYLSFLLACLPVCLTVCFFAFLYISFAYLSVCILPFYRLVCLFACLAVYLSICLAEYLPSYLLPFSAQDRLATLAKDAENTRLDLNDKIIALTRKLESLEEFRQHKEELEGKLSALEEELATSRDEHKEKASWKFLLLCCFVVFSFFSLKGGSSPLEGGVILFAFP